MAVHDKYNIQLMNDFEVYMQIRAKYFFNVYQEIIQ